jgi:hypothetical protein
LADQHKSHGPGCAETAPPSPMAPVVPAANSGQKVDALATLLSATHL